MLLVGRNSESYQSRDSEKTQPRFWIQIITLCWNHQLLAVRTHGNWWWPHYFVNWLTFELSYIISCVTNFMICRLKLFYWQTNLCWDAWGHLRESCSGSEYESTDSRVNSSNHYHISYSVLFYHCFVCSLGLTKCSSKPKPLLWYLLSYFKRKPFLFKSSLEITA